MPIGFNADCEYSRKHWITNGCNGWLETMQLSTRGRYAVMALADLAVREARSAGQHPVTLAEIATGQVLSLSYLEQLFGKLRRAGLVTSVRGPGGGYRLARPLEDIPVGAVIAAMDGPITLAACVDGSPNECESLALCPVRGRWDPVNDAIQQALSGITLADMRSAAIPPALRIPQAAE